MKVPAAARYCAFARVQGKQPPGSAVPEGYSAGFLGLAASGTRGVSPALRSWILRWRLVCSVHGRPNMPYVYVVRNGGEVVHYSFVLPATSRAKWMAYDDIEIGPCWTHPGHRRQGIFRHAIENIYRELWSANRVVWMLAREDNSASRAGIEKAGFRQLAWCERMPHAFLPIHTYFIVDTAGRRIGTRSARGIRDTFVEEVRYNFRAHELADDLSDLQPHGAAAVRETLREPFALYHEYVADASRAGVRIADLCCGDGLHSLTGALKGAEVLAVDLAAESLQLAEARAKANGASIATYCASVENLPFRDGSIDVVTCAGGISYVDRERFLAELDRVLRPGGTFIFVDSYNLNWIYRLNRYVHWIRHRRTLSTLRRMPDARLLEELRRRFGEIEVRYFGVLVFLVPVLVRLVGESMAARFISRTDAALAAIRAASFRIVVRGQKPGRSS